MKKTKIVYILSNVDKAIAFEWIAEHLDKSKFIISFILLNDKKSTLYDFLKNKKNEAIYIHHRGKKSYPETFFKIVLQLYKIKPDIVHTHLFDANLIGLTAAKLLGVKKRIYTRHHSTFHHTYFPEAIKYDKWSNQMATHIVAISKNVEKVLEKKENVSGDKISLIHHGFKIENFQAVNPSAIEALKLKYHITNNSFPIVGVVARYIKWKGIQYIVSAFEKLLKNYPNAKLVLANANGPDANYIRDLLKQIPKENYIEIKFENNLFALYHLFDVFVHTPIDGEIEAFGQTYIEALAAGIPSIFTLSGIAHEFIEDKQNALVVDYKNSDQIYNSIIELLKNKELKMRLIENGRASVEQFKLSIFIRKLESIYLK